MLGIQIVGIGFVIFMFYLTFLSLKRKELSNMESLVWFSLWISLIYITILPNSLDFLVKRVLSFQRPLDFFIVMGFLFMIFISFVNYIKNKENEHKITRIVTKIAFKENLSNDNSGDDLTKKMPPKK